MISRDCKTTTPQQSYWQGITSRLMLLTITAYLLTSLPAAEATGWWRKGVRSAGPLLFSSPGGAVDDDIDAVLRKVEEEQRTRQEPVLVVNLARGHLNRLWGEVERVGFETLEVEVAEKKRGKIIAGVAKACSAGTQITAIMCGGGLLFRLLPVLLGRDVEDQEEVEADSALLLQSGDGSRLPGLPLNRRPFFLTNGGVTDGPEVAAAVAARKPNGEGGAFVSGSLGELVEVAAADGEVVAFTERRATLKRVRRLSRPFLRVMASSFTMLLMARLFLGDLLAARINPETELLFSDDVINTYAEKVDVPEEADEAIPFPQDSEQVPGRRKMKGRSIQRLPRPPGESETE